MDFGKLLIAIGPLLLINLLGIFYPPNQNIVKPIFQPPNWVFPLVWTYLLGILGVISSLHFKQVSVFYFLLLFCLSLWLVLFYYKLYGLSFYLLIVTSYITIIFTSYLAYLKLKHLSVLFLPFPFWLVLASCLNGVIYNNKITK